ncbi:MAG: peptidylprolyl isomerase [Pseudopedobacter sp.]|nr:peptidylprolyl isomerase [Deinococcales bacterium]
MKIQENSVVKLEYTLFKDSAKQPSVSQTLLMGHAHLLISGLEPKLWGHEPGDFLELDLTVPYDDSLKITAPLESLPQGIGPGEVVTGEDANGKALGYRIVALEGNTAVLDANPENAGYKITAVVNILEVRGAEPSELEHGHVHGEGGVKH